jgi:hypothetical protein
VLADVGDGKETAVIGYETAKQLDVEPAKYFDTHPTEQRGALHEEQGVQCAWCLRELSRKVWPAIGCVIVLTPMHINMIMCI